MSKHPDETESDDEAQGVRTPFNGPMGRTKVFKPPRSKWRQVVIPDYVRNASRVQEPLTRQEVYHGEGRVIELAVGVRMTLRQQQEVVAGLEPDRQWAYAIVGKFKPCSRHKFRVQVSAQELMVWSRCMCVRVRRADPELLRSEQVQRAQQRVRVPAGRPRDAHGPTRGLLIV